MRWWPVLSLWRRWQRRCPHRRRPHPRKRASPQSASPQSASATAAPSGPVQATGGPALPATTPMTDLLMRMDALETQMARLTAQNEEMANRQHQLQTRLDAVAPPPAPASALAPAPATMGPTLGAGAPHARRRASTGCGCPLRARAQIGHRRQSVGDERRGIGICGWRTSGWPGASLCRTDCCGEGGDQAADRGRRAGRLFLWVQALYRQALSGGRAAIEALYR